MGNSIDVGQVKEVPVHFICYVHTSKQWGPRYVDLLSEVVSAEDSLYTQGISGHFISDCLQSAPTDLTSHEQNEFGTRWDHIFQFTVTYSKTSL